MQAARNVKTLWKAVTSLVRNANVQRCGNDEIHQLIIIRSYPTKLSTLSFTTSRVFYPRELQD